ncbi:MAG: metalloprotease PmbA [Pseudomonadota bacterium]|nr:MAG: metalloprotease PmbA [Pseudomonadota bacterium]
MSSPASVSKPSLTIAETRARFETVAADVLAEAKRLGASQAEVNVNISQGLSVTVRLGEVETLEHTRDKGLGVTVYFGQRSGAASTTDFSSAAVRDTVRAACSIAKYTAEDDCAGLADADRLAHDPPDLGLYHPWGLSAEAAITMARECEAAAMSFDGGESSSGRITNSEGGSVTTHEGYDLYANSHGFIGAVPVTRHSLSTSVIAQAGSGMQRDYWYDVARDARMLDSARAIGEQAARRTLRRLGARKLSTRHCPVVFEAPVASSLISHFVGAVRGTNLYREASFLLGALGQQVFAPQVRIHEEPHLIGALGSAAFDSEGVATSARELVHDGVLQGYVLDSYSARKLKLATTGNAGGVHNLVVDPGPDDLVGLLRTMSTGLLVTELIGFGVNLVTGDYSRGAAGFWVEGGQIQYPVEEITIAGNLRDMFRGVTQIGTDIDTRGNIRCGSILLERMTVAGS